MYFGESGIFYFALFASKEHSPSTFAQHISNAIPRGMAEKGVFAQAKILTRTVLKVSFQSYARGMRTLFCSQSSRERPPLAFAQHIKNAIPTGMAFLIWRRERDSNP